MLSEAKHLSKGLAATRRARCVASVFSLERFFATLRMTRSTRLVRLAAIGSLLLLALALAGCPRPSAPAPPALLPPAEQAVAAWPPILLDEAPGQVALPWAVAPGTAVELWRIDLMDADRPELPAWLETRERRPAPLAMTGAPGIGSERLTIARPGAYLVRSAAVGQARLALVLASRLRAALVIEDLDFEVYCADGRTGQPVPRAFVRVVYRTERLGRDCVLTASGLTDAAGRWHGSMVRDRFARLVVATAIVAQDDQYAVATERREFDPLEADYRLSLRPRSLTVAPGERAELAGLLQRRSGERFVPAANVGLKLWLVDPRGTAVDSAATRTDAVGAFQGTLPIAKEAAPGAYSVVVVGDGAPGLEPRWMEAFSVVARPASPVRLSLSLDRSIVAPGEAMTLTVAARTADDKPLAGAPVHLVSWGYPVAADGKEAWANGSAQVDQARAEVLPLRLPTELKTDADGQAVVRWQTASGDVPRQDLLCGIQATATAPDGGRGARTVELVLLGEPAAIAVVPDALFHAPSEPIALTFASPLLPAQAKIPATCSLAFEDAKGQVRRYDLLRAPVGSLTEQRLAVRATRPGRYTFAVRAGQGVSEATVWVAAEEGDVAWHGAATPTLIPERSWARHGEALRVVAAAPGPAEPLALTLRSGGRVERQNLALRTGARSLKLRPVAPLAATLVQFHRGTPLVGRSEIDVEPGGSVLDVLLRLLWVRQGDWSGRGFAVTTQDRLGSRAQSVVGVELVRPTFEGVPPVAVRRKTLEAQRGKATNEGGEIEIGLEEPLFTHAYALLVEARSPDGRAGHALAATSATRRAPEAKAEAPLSARDKLALLVRIGITSPAERWMVACLLARHPDLAGELPKLIASIKSDDGAIALLGLAAAYPSVAGSALDAALGRGGSVRPRALALGAEFAQDARPALQQVLATDPTPAARVAAARALGGALPASQASLALALRTDLDPVVRAAAASALARGDAEAMGTLISAAQQETHPDVQRAIVAALRQIGGPSAVGPLLDLAGARNADVAAAAVRALADIGYRGTDHRLLRILRTAPPSAQAEAAALLASSPDPQAVEALFAAAKEASGPVVQALAALGSAKVQAAMGEWLDHKDPSVRLAAAEYLGARKDERARPVLRSFLDPSLPAEAADRAARLLIAWRDDVAAPKLVPLLEAGRLSAATQLDLIRVAGKLGWTQAGRSLVTVLVRGLAEPGRFRQADERKLWIEAAEAVCVIGPILPTVVDSALGPAPPDPLYAPAVAALRAEGFPGFFHALWRAPLPDELRREAVLAYARLRGPTAAPELVEWLESPVLQGAAAQALAKAGAVDLLLAALRSASPRTRSAAAAALGAIGEERAVPALEPLVRDADSFVRLEAAWALAALTRRPVAYTDHLGELRQAEPLERHED